MLVDSAKAPMLEGPTSLLRAVAASGYQKKLGFAFHAFRPRAIDFCEAAIRPETLPEAHPVYDTAALISARRIRDEIPR